MSDVWWLCSGLKVSCILDITQQEREYDQEMECSSSTPQIDWNLYIFKQIVSLQFQQCFKHTKMCFTWSSVNFQGKLLRNTFGAVSDLQKLPLPQLFLKRFQLQFIVENFWKHIRLLVYYNTIIQYCITI